MHSNNAEQLLDRDGKLALAWAGSTSAMDYLNFGDALSPVMVALCSGYPVERYKFKSEVPRLAAVGTIGHGLEGGNVWTWGTGSSAFRNPSAPSEERIRYTPPADTNLTLCATRGPVSASLLSGGTHVGDGVYGDPVWMLPRFYNPSIEKKYEIGVILHLSELTSRAYTMDYNPAYKRYDVPDEYKDAVRLINTVTPISVAALKDKVDEILSCKRIVSTSLHGMVIAESYGIPCLYFSPNGKIGSSTVGLDPHGTLDLRIVDLYRGLGLEELPLYVQPRASRTDWGALIDAIDAGWFPKQLKEEDLLAAFPLPRTPVVPAAGQTVWDHPAIQGLTFQHSVTEINRREKLRKLGRS